MRINLKRQTPGDILFDTLNVIFMVLLCATMVYPFLYLISMSFGNSATMGINLIPKTWDTGAYTRVFRNEYIISGFGNTLLRTGVGTALTVFISICTAYPLSKRKLPHRGLWTGLIIFTMFFSGGLIPSYLLVRGLHLNNTIWSLVLPGLINTFNMIIMRNFFMSLPDSLEESAKIDGANDILILFRIVVPISLPIIATVLLWSAVGHWNAWFDCMIYISEPKKQVLQLVLYRIVMEGNKEMMDNGINENFFVSSDAVKAATIVVTTLPIMVVYPFVQKYFVKGVMVGSLKG